MLLPALCGPAVVHAESAGICARTQQVRDAIVTAAGVGACADVTERHLREITSLDLGGLGITALGADDFGGLVRLHALDLSHNQLGALPEGVFDELFLLHRLRLDNNNLSTVPATLFEALFFLEELTLDGNPSLVLPEGLFGDFSPFAGLSTDGTLAAPSGSYPRLRRFLTTHDVTTPEGFIEALPDVYKERFVMIYASQATAADHVFEEYPRIASFGADGRYTFAWNTNPSAPSRFRDAVEFLRQNEADWSAGIIDFTQTPPAISEPAGCRACHGSLNKPLWGGWFHWRGTEWRPVDDPGYAAAAARLKLHMASDDERLAPLDFSASVVYASLNQTQRYFRSPGQEGYVTAVHEAGALWSWRHAEVLLAQLKLKKRDFRAHAEDLMCSSWNTLALSGISDAFHHREHNLFVPANIEDRYIDDQGRLHSDGDPDKRDFNSNYVTFNYQYQPSGSLPEALWFLVLADLFQREPIVRKLYRDTSNHNAIARGVSSYDSPAMLHYAPGEASAEDELIQLLRMHFGHGSRAALELRAAQNEKVDFNLRGSVLSAAFGDAQLKAMTPKVCAALTRGAARNLGLALDGTSALLTWDAPDYTDAPSGYRILRATRGGPLVVLIDDTGSTDTEYADRDLSPGEVRYAVKALYDGYPSPLSDAVAETVPEEPPVVSLAAVASPVTEGSNAEFWVRRSGSATQPLTVAIRWAYRHEPTEERDSLLLVGGADSTRAVVPTENDNVVGEDRLLTLTLEPGPGYALGGEASASVTVADDDAAEWSVAVAPADLEEGATATVTVSIGNGVTYAAARTIALSAAGQVTARDYRFEPAVLTLPAGSTSAAATLTATADDAPEDTETATVTARLDGAEIGAASVSIRDPAPPPTPAIAGVAQVGNALRANFADPAPADLTYQWLRGDVEVIGASEATYTPIAADAGHALVLRVSRGGRSAASAPTGPVWGAPGNPPLAPDEEELLATLMTVGSTNAYVLRLAGYGRLAKASFGSLDATALSRDGVEHEIGVAALNSAGEFALGPRAQAWDGDALWAYWDGHRIGPFAVRDSSSEGPMLVAPTTQPAAEYLRYTDGSSDGVRVALSIRRTRPAAPPPAATLAAVAASVTEGDAAAFDVVLDAPAAAALEVSVSVTAEGGVLSGEAPASVIVATGETRATLTLPTSADTLVEDDGSITATLLAGEGYTLGEPVTATVTVEDDDATARFTAVPETNDGTAFEVGVALSGQIPGVSYVWVRDTLVTATNATVTRARRASPGSNADWLLTVRPSSADVTLTVAEGLVLNNGLPLTGGAAVTVRHAP